jgi:4-diphosphocytidyl-2-C-methyl-D-erythritol kinase
VPFFVGGRNAFVGGIGEHAPADLHCRAVRYAVVKPAPAIATAQIFSTRRSVRDTEPVIVEGSLDDAYRSDAWAGAMAGTTCSPRPKPSAPRWRKSPGGLEASFGNSRMTGSGSAVFARQVAGAGAFTAATLPVNFRPRVGGSDVPQSGSHPLWDWASSDGS